MGLPMVTVDAFTGVRLAGNPAATCILLRGRADAEWMQKVATEMNLALADEPLASDPSTFAGLRRRSRSTFAGAQPSAALTCYGK